IWMPTDQRLLWLLAEVLNASVMECTTDKARNRMLRSTYAAFNKLNSFENPPPFAPAIRDRLAVLKPVIDQLPPENELDLKQIPELTKDLPPDSPLSTTDWWRIGIGF